MKFAICNLGCKVNNYEANWYSQMLKENYDEVEFKDKADIYIINSCTVTNMAGSKSRQMIHKARKQNENSIICCISCYVQMEYLKNPDVFDDCQIIVGSKNKDKLPQYIKEYIETKQRIVDVEKFEVTSFEKMYLESFNQTRAYLKIQDGCNQFCSYCTIPLARGRERCLNRIDVIKQAQKLVSQGHSEIVLTGIHTGRWHDNDCDLTRLIKDLLNEVEGLERIRLSSIEMTEITDELIDLMANDYRIARHLHIPLQTGTDRLLALNNRPYTTQDYLQRVNTIRERIPDISISSDIIAGLPTESDQEAKETEEFIKKCRLSFLHVFPYAKKESTPDALLPQVNDTVKKARAVSLTNLSSELYNEYATSLVGKMVDVIFETYKDGINIGHCSQYVPVQLVSDINYSNKLVKVKIVECNDHILKGILYEY